MLDGFYALFDKAKLPSKYHSEHIAEDGTMVILEIQQQFKILKPETQQELANYNITQLLGSHGDKSTPCVQLTTQSDLPLATNSAHFRLHYTTSGMHAVPTTDTNVNRIPDYVERVRDDFEASWSNNFDSLLWESPRPDGPIGGGGSDLIDIYFYDTISFSTVPFNGAVIPHSIDASTPNPNDWIGYVCFDNNLSPFLSEATSAHEFHHLVQFAYNAVFSTVSSWMMESTSRWFEDEVFDNNNRYAGVNAGAGEFLSKPDLSLTSTFGLREYGAGIWHRFVSDQYGDYVIRNTWVYASEAPQGTGARFTDNIRAIEDVTQSGNWQEAFYAFAVNNLFTGAFDTERGTHFEAEESSYIETIIQ